MKATMIILYFLMIMSKVVETYVKYLALSLVFNEKNYFMAVFLCMSVVFDIYFKTADLGTSY